MRTLSYRGSYPQPFLNHITGPRTNENYPESVLCEFLPFPSSHYSGQLITDKKQTKIDGTLNSKLSGLHILDTAKTSNLTQPKSSGRLRTKIVQRSIRKDLSSACYPPVHKSCMLGKMAKDLRIRIHNARDCEHMHEYTEAFFAKVLSDERIINNCLLSNALKLIEQYPKKIFAQVSQELKVSQRQLRRVFKENLGLSPKTYLRLKRLHEAAKLALSQDVTEFQEIIYECGYYDQSHFVRDIKLFTGRKPSSFFKKCRVVA